MRCPEGNSFLDIVIVQQEVGTNLPSQSLGFCFPPIPLVPTFSPYLSFTWLIGAEGQSLREPQCSGPRDRLSPPPPNALDMTASPNPEPREPLYTRLGRGWSLGHGHSAN